MTKSKCSTTTPGERRALPGLFALGFLLATGCGGESSPTSSEPPAPVDLSCPGEPLSAAPLRRLTRFEYANAVRDVFGVELALEDIFPRDEIALGFDNQGGTLSLTDLHVEGYLEAASNVADWLVADPARIAGLGGCSDPTPECARELTASLGRKLERRRLSDVEIEGLLALFGAEVSADNFADGLSRVVAALLQNPEFLYRLERSAGASEGELASPFVLASRLAFLLWGSGPDDALLDAAESGSLATAEDVAREARRLLDDAERSRRGVLHFYMQWLKLSDFSAVEKDRQLFRLWDENLQAELARETARFLDAVLREGDARLETLLTAPYSFTNGVLENFYGLPIRDPDSTELVRLDFDAGVPRRGLLTQGSILSAQAKPNQTDPIHRGKFIREQFFCQIPLPPPADLVVSPPRLDPRRTTRERFEQHRADASCASCHEFLDPVGLAFEHYDAVGRYRETESGAPVDATGYLVGTDVDGPIDGVNELADKLVASDSVRRCVITHWFRFAFGRGETEADSCTLGKLEQLFESSDGNLRELLVALTQVDAFLRPAPSPELEVDP